MSLNQDIKFASAVVKAWNYLGCNENKQLCDHEGAGKGWMADKNRWGEVYVFILSLESNRHNIKSTKTCVSSVEFPGYILHDSRIYVVSLCLNSPCFLFAFRLHIPDSKMLIIKLIVMKMDRSYTEILGMVTYTRTTCQGLARTGI